MNMDTMVQILATIWNAGGIPLLLGTVTSGVTQHLKTVPMLAPFLASENIWLTRGFIALGCVVLQIAFDLISRQPVNLTLIHDLIINYFAASVAYVHIFKPLEAPKA